MPRPLPSGSIEEGVTDSLRNELADRIKRSEDLMKVGTGRFPAPTFSEAEFIMLNNQIATMRALSWLLLMQEKA